MAVVLGQPPSVRIRRAIDELIAVAAGIEDGSVPDKKAGNLLNRPMRRLTAAQALLKSDDEPEEE